MLSSLSRSLDNDPESHLYSLTDGETLDLDNRFCDEYKSKYLTEDASEFCITAKLDDAVRYLDQFTFISKRIYAEISRSVASSSASHLLKLETDSIEITTFIAKLHASAARRLATEIKLTQGDNDSDNTSVNITGNINFLLRLATSHTAYTNTNAFNFTKESKPFIDALKELVETIFTYTQHTSNSIAAALYFDFQPYIHLISPRCLYATELKLLFLNQDHFESVIKSSSSSPAANYLATKILLPFSEALAQEFLTQREDDKLEQLT